MSFEQLRDSWKKRTEPQFSITVKWGLAGVLTYASQKVAIWLFPFSY